MLLVLTLTLAIVAGGCGSGSSGGAIQPPVGVKLTSITIDPNDPSIADGTTLQLQATGNYSDGTTKDLTGTVTWTSNDGSVAQVSSSFPTEGLATAQSPGSTLLTATLGSVQGSMTLTVTPATLASIDINPPDPSIAKGTAVQLGATGNFSDGSTQNLTTSAGWTSADATIAQVSDLSGSKGLVSGVDLGTVSITATQAAINGSTDVTVTAATLDSITIQLPDPSIAKGTTIQLTATGDFSDGTTEDLTSFATWSSAGGSVAAVSNTSGSKGLVSGLMVGSAAITASFGSASGSSTVTVTAARLTHITVDPAASSIAKGTFVELKATGDFTDGTTEDITTQVGWTSSNNSIAEVSNAAGTQGLVSGHELGGATIQATLNGVHGFASVTVTAAVLTSISVTPASPSIAKGTSIALLATGHFSDSTTEDLTDEAGWISADDTIAHVSNFVGTKGLVTGIDVGVAAVTATFGGVQGSTNVTVTVATLVSLTVTPATPSIAKGTTVQLTATGLFSDATTHDLTDEVSWISANGAVAQVSSSPGAEGLVEGAGVGSTAITATLSGIQGSATVTVTAATLAYITIAPSNPTMMNKTTLQLTATGHYSDGTTEDITTLADWTSSDTHVAHVISSSAHTNGRVIARNPGTTTITATLGGLHGSTHVTVRH
jgi:uncharacterized protein YjdB